MSDAVVENPVPVDQVAGWVRAMETTHLGDPHRDDLAWDVDVWARGWEPERIWGVRDRGWWVATLATDRRSITVPGPGVTTNDLTVDSVTGAAVAATHRRRGLLSEMMRGSMDAARRRGDALSILVASEWPIYGRYGYAPATQMAAYSLYRRAAGRVAGGDPTRVRPMHRGELGDIAAAVFDASRRLRVGQVDRSGTWWQRRLAIEPYGAHANADLNWYVHDGPAGPDGLLAWKPKPGVTLNGPQATVNVIGPIAASDAAYRDLYAYLLGIDFVDHLELVLRPVDEPLRWIIDDGRALHLTDLVDGLWVRLLDVSAALAARAYAVTGRLVLEVVDTSMGGPAAGRYELVSDEGRSTCVRTEAPPDLTIDQRTLASIYLGGHRLHQFATADHLREHSPGALDLTDLWFSTPIPPWNQTMF